MKTLITPLWFIFVLAVMVSCSSPKQAPLAGGSDPQKAVTEVTQIKQQALTDQLDVLADEPFKDGSDYLGQAQTALVEDGEGARALEKAGIAKAFFNDAQNLADMRRDYVRQLLDVRAQALAAGARQSEALREELNDVDDDLKDDSKQFSRTLSPEEHAHLEKRYLDLEIHAVQYRQLHDARQAIDTAKDQNAEGLAPQSLALAEKDYLTAGEMIALHPRDPAAYKPAVDAELSSASLLVDVMKLIKKNSGTPEPIAIQIVKQQRKLGTLSTTLQTTQQTLQEKEQTLQNTQKTLQEKESSLQSTQQTLQQKEGRLKEQEQQLARASTAVRFQQAMEEARQMIPEKDALAYQQGNKLVFRLKRMNFRSGTAVIPSFSKLLLDKVDAIIKKLDAEKVVVQGHTDSVGTEAVNKKLSQERALAVANYLYRLKGGYRIQYSGFGESQPIASNETEAGRAMNRRVDLVVSVKE